jgi:hypothetical protein
VQANDVSSFIVQEKDVGNTTIIVSVPPNFSQNVETKEDKNTLVLYLKYDAKKSEWGKEKSV